MEKHNILYVQQPAAILYIVTVANDYLPRIYFLGGILNESKHQKLLPWQGKLTYTPRQKLIDQDNFLFIYLSSRHLS